MNNASMKSLGGHMFLLFLGSYLGIELLGHMFNSLRNCKTVF